MQLVKTVDWKREVKQWEIFEAYDNDAESWFRSYKWMFEKVEDKEIEKNEEKKDEKKAEWKKAKAKK